MIVAVKPNCFGNWERVPGCNQCWCSGSCNYEVNKPFVRLVGENGNIYNLIMLAGRALRLAGYKEKDEELKSRLDSCNSYDEALQLIGEYVDIC